MTALRRMCCLAVMILPCLLAQQETEEKDLKKPFHCGDRLDLPMSKMDKACYWWTNSFNAEMIAGAAFTTALDPIFNGSSDKYWGQGAEGFAKRFGTRVAQSFTKGSGQALVGAIFHEDPRFYPSHKTGFWPRFGFAVVHTFVVKHDDGSQWFSAGRVAGAVGSGFIGEAWTPGPINTTSAALTRTGTAFGGILAGSVFNEFEPDIMKLGASLFSKRPKK